MRVSVAFCVQGREVPKIKLVASDRVGRMLGIGFFIDETDRNTKDADCPFWTYLLDLDGALHAVGCSYLFALGAWNDGPIKNSLGHGLEVLFIGSSRIISPGEG